MSGHNRTKSEVHFQDNPIDFESFEDEGISQADILSRLPSRQLTASLDRTRSLDNRPSSLASLGTLRMRHSMLDTPDGEQDNEVEAWKRIQHIKGLTSSLDVKRQARSRLLSSPATSASNYQKWKLKKSKSWKYTKLQLREVFSGLRVWHSSFKDVEGSFGSSVVSYFRFVRWLFFLNLFTTVTILAVIVLPQLILDPDTFQQSIVQPETNISIDDTYINEADRCTTLYITGLETKQQNNTVWWKILDFFQGTGWMENTALFMGFYFNKTYVYSEWQINYNMPVAYLLTTAIYFCVGLILMVQYTGRAKQDMLMSSGEKFNHTCNKVFCGWDYSLTKLKAATQKHKDLTLEYQNDLAEQRLEKQRQQRTPKEKCRLFTIRFFAWFIVLLGIVGTMTLIFFVTSEWMPALLEDESVQDNRILNLLVQYLPSITITVVAGILSLIYAKIATFEDYSPESEVKITTGRTVVLRLVSVCFLIVTLYITFYCTDAEDLTCGNCKPDITRCWETYFGQQFYKLAILDFIIDFFIVFFMEFPRKLLVKHFPENKLLKMVGLQEFEIPKNLLDLVYSQTVCWIGGFFSPLIPAITVIKLFILFYIKKLTLMKNCLPSSRVYRASRSNSFFMSIMMFSFVMCILPIAVAIARFAPSQGCGPFRIYSTEEFYMHTSLDDAIHQLPSWLENTIEIITSYVFYIPACTLLILIIYFYMALSARNSRMVNLLKEQMALVGKDKQFLLTRVNQALMRGDFQLNKSE